MALPFVVLAFAHSPWWLVALLLGALARVAKSLWVRREGRGLIWLLKPIQFAGVGVILAAIDLATFVGWVQARWKGIPDLTTDHTEQHGKTATMEDSFDLNLGIV